MNGSTHSLSASTAVVEQPPVAAAMNKLRSNREELHTLLERLEERLSVVLSPVPPHPVGDGSKPIHESPLHGALVSEGEFIDEANRRILSLLGRLTV